MLHPQAREPARAEDKLPSAAAACRLQCGNSVPEAGKKGEPELIPSAYSRQGGVDDPALWLTGLYGPGSGKRLPSWMRGGAYLHEVPHACREVLVALRSGQVVTPNSATCGAWGLPG